MSSGSPPVPPRPDLSHSWETPQGPATWRHGEPGDMGATRIVGAGLRLWAENWVAWFVVTLALTGTIAVVTAAVDPWSTVNGVTIWIDEVPRYRPDPNALAVVLTLVSVFFLGPWELVILTKAALRATFSEPLRGRELIGRTIVGVRSLVWIFVVLILFSLPLGIVLAGIARATRSADAGALLGLVSLAAFLLLVPRLATVVNVFVGEDARGSKAIAGAWHLSRGAWGTSAGTILLSILIAIAVAILPELIVAEVFPAPEVGDAVARTVVQSLLNAVVTPIGIAIVTVLYLELRERAGQLDQAALRRNLARFD
jgi:hypothetical protein